MDLHATYPNLSDLRSRAQSRLPKFVWEYLDSATGTEATKHRNRAALDRVGLIRLFRGLLVLSGLFSGLDCADYHALATP